MPNFTKTSLLGEQVGIQLIPLSDSDNSPKNKRANGVPLIIGYFKRGTPYQIITVTLENVRAKLGYTPKNPHYTIILSMLNSGISSVNVLCLGNWSSRVSSNHSNTISCSNEQHFTVSRKDSRSSTKSIIKVYSDSTRTTIKKQIENLSFKDGIYNALNNAMSELNVKLIVVENFYNFNEAGEKGTKISLINKSPFPIFFDLALNQPYSEGEELHLILPKSECVKYGEQDHDQQTLNISLGGSSQPDFDDDDDDKD